MACVHVVNDAPYAPKAYRPYPARRHSRNKKRQPLLACGVRHFPPANYRCASIQDNDNTTTTFLIAGTKRQDKGRDQAGGGGEEEQANSPAAWD